MSDTPEIGHNQPEKSEAYLELEQRREDLLAVGNKWVTERPVFENEEVAGKANDYLTEVQAFKKAADKLHKEEKAPFLEGGRKIDGQKKALIDPMATVEKTIRERRTAYLVKQDNIRKEAERKAREIEQEKQAEADRKREAAEQALKDANAGNAKDVDVVAVQEAADKAEKDAEEAARTTKTLASTKTAVGGKHGNKVGLREEWSAEITDYDAALEAFKTNEEMKELVQKIANQLARSPASRKMSYPGIKFVSRPKS